MTTTRSVKSIVAKGDRRQSLEALRDLLATRLQKADERDTAALTRELRAVLAEIDSIPVAREDSVADTLAAGHEDELAKRRARGRKNA